MSPRAGAARAIRAAVRRRTTRGLPTPPPRESHVHRPALTRVFLPVGCAWTARARKQPCLPPPRAPHGDPAVRAAPGPPLQASLLSRSFCALQKPPGRQDLTSAPWGLARIQGELRTFQNTEPNSGGLGPSHAPSVRACLWLGGALSCRAGTLGADGAWPSPRHPSWGEDGVSQPRARS